MFLEGKFQLQRYNGLMPLPSETALLKPSYSLKQPQAP